MARRQSVLKSLVGVVAGFAFLTGPALSQEAARYDLWTMISDNKAVIAVSAHGEAKHFSVAAGAEAGALNILDADEAKAALTALRERMDSHSVERILAHHDPSDKKRMQIIQREVIEANERIGSGHEAVIEIEQESDKIIDLDKNGIDDQAFAKVMEAEKPKAGGGAIRTVIQTNESGVATKLVLVSGAGADAARDFVNKTDGLSNVERAIMISALGL